MQQQKINTIYRFNGDQELKIILKILKYLPTNTEIVERTGVSKGSISEIMNGKRAPSKKFIEKMKKGFNLKDVEIVPNYSSDNQTLLKDKLIELYEAIFKSQTKTIEIMNNEIDRLNNKLI